MDEKHDHNVSPPLEGIILLYKMDAKGGLGLNVTSVCQTSVSGGLFSSFSKTWLKHAEKYVEKMIKKYISREPWLYY